jgi:signal transduction histidine kinase
MDAYGDPLCISYDRSRIQERSQKVAVLLDISNFLASSLNLRNILDGALARVLEHFAFDGGRIYLTEQGGSRLRLAAHMGIEPQGLELVELNEGFTGRAARTRSFLVGNVRDLDDRNRIQLLLGKGCETIVCVPMVALDEVVGVMNLATERVIELDRRNIDLLLIVGNQIATAVNNARLYADNRRRLRELEEKKETIQFFAFSASHDLKCPAVGLHGLAELLQRKYAGALDQKGQELIGQILKTSKHILGLTDRINSYIAAKESPLKVERVRVREVLEMIRDEFTSALQARNICWTVPQTEVEIDADRLALLRFFQNCVDNSLKYGGERLTEIRVGYCEAPDSHILSVSDDGIGLNQQEAEGLFELFRRHETSNGTEGSGLGLAIVKELAERHGGRAWVQTEVGKGATFFLSIPKRPLPDD